VVTHSDGAAEREATFEFGRRLGDAHFRKVIARHGLSSPQDVVVALDNTPFPEVLDRVFKRCKPPALVAVRRPATEHGFVFLMFSPADMPQDDDSDNDIPLNDAVSVGMVFDSLAQLAGARLAEIGPHYGYSVQSIRELTPA
jgi:hypothetical protein